MTHEKKAIKNYERFHQRKVKKVEHLEFTMPKALTFLGLGKSVEYISDKPLQGKVKVRLYRHKFGSGVKIYLHPNGKWLLISGGKFRVTDWLRN